MDWNKLRSGPWAVPAAAGSLILTSLVAAKLFHLSRPADLLMLAAAAVAGGPIVVKALRALRYRIISIDLLVSIAAIGAVVIGEYWESAAVTFLFALGNALEAATLAKTRSAIADLIAVAPQVAIVIRDGEQVEVPAFQVRVGEVVLVKNGAKVPVDGVVIAGSGAVEEASITGEPLPQEKVVGDPVYAGTISKGGLLQVEATGVGGDTTLGRIIHRVEEAQDAKAPTAKFMDRFAKWYTPGIIAAALVAGITTRDVELALTLLVVGCPGALVISIPVSVVAGIGRGARDGVLIKGGQVLEDAAKVNAVALDKTGTITVGRPQLAQVVPTARGMTELDVLRWAAQAEAGSEHPLAAPILQAASQRGVLPPHVPEEVVSTPGKGIQAVVGGRHVLAGNPSLMRSEAVGGLERAEAVADKMAGAGQTPMLIAVDQQLIGVIAVADTIRPEAKQAVTELRRLGVSKVVMLTGDARAVAETVAAETGIDQVHAGLLPEDKQRLVEQIQQAGYRVAMVGDGVNDAPALATADTGAAMGAAASAVAVETADIALLGENLLRLPRGLSLAKRTRHNMTQNIVIALATVLALLAGVLFGGVTMAAGMLIHEGSVLVVILNAMRLLREQRPGDKAQANGDRENADREGAPKGEPERTHAGGGASACGTVS